MSTTVPLVHHAGHPLLGQHANMLTIVPPPLQGRAKHDIRGPRIEIHAERVDQLTVGLIPVSALFRNVDRTGAGEEA
jgi:hypothetical protein